MIRRVILGLLLLGLFAPTLAQDDEENIPYIYYYSHIHHAIVIERADGTDSRLLGENLMPEEHDTIYSVKWSPSGEWVAWLSTVGTLPVRLWIMKSDGSQQVQLDNLYSVDFIEWSPNEDYLMVVNISPHPEYAKTVSVVDVPNNDELIEMTLNGTYGQDPIDHHFLFQHGWTDDGTAVYFPHHKFRGATVVRMGLDNRTESWTFDRPEHLIDFGRGRLVHLRVILAEGTQIIITDLSSQEEMILVPSGNWPDVANLDYDLYWNDDASYALVQEKSCEERDYRCEFTATKILNWQEKTLIDLPTNLFVDTSFYFFRFSYHLLFSPNGDLAIVFDENQKPYLVDLQHGEVHSLLVDEVTRWYWVADKGIILQNRSDSLDYYDFESHEISQDMNFNGISGYHTVASPNGEYIVTGLSNTVINLRTSEMLDWPSHSNVISTWGLETDYLWHEDSEWFFSDYSNWISLINIDNPIHLELTICGGVCMGFMPKRAIPHLAEGQPNSHTPAPIMILPHEHSVGEVAWNHDGTLLASYSVQTDNGPTLYIWDMANENPEIINQLEVEFTCPYYTSPCSMWWEDDSTITLTNFRGYHKINITTAEVEKTTVDINLNNTSPDGRFTVTWSSTEWTIVENSTGNIINTMPIGNDDIALVPILWATDSLSVIIQQHDAPYYLWDGENTYELESSWMHYQMDYNANSGLAVTSGLYHPIDLWNVETGELMPFNWTAYGVDFSPDGMLLAATGLRYVTIWDMRPYIAP